MNTTKVILLKNRPSGKPSSSDFEFTEEQVPEINDGEILLETAYVSVDPYLRGRMQDAKSYVPPFELNKPIHSGVVAKVIATKNDNFKEGDYVSGMLDWKEVQKSTGEELHKVSKDNAPLPAYLGTLGMTGLTAYFGLKEIGKPKEGETILVSGAAGAVGSIVGQIAKIKGCRVVGVAGSDEKIEKLKKDFSYDDGFNYNTEDDLNAAIQRTCPDGVDVYWDNVGGELSDAVFFNINQKARIINCGAIAVYNDNKVPTGVSPQVFLIKNSALMQGFIVSNYMDSFPEGVQQLSKWYGEGKLHHEDTIVEGFENIPQAFIDLFDGKNTGKMLVKI
ncbi:NADP-dependent oxidoreductase [Dokdonia genika]|uniref:NADP-dependent oxidoreductase n=1 Tax=Dokdonia genika TaxID=308113 RepID=A0ABV9LCZ5_9FLAO